MHQEGNPSLLGGVLRVQYIALFCAVLFLVLFFSSSQANALIAPTIMNFQGRLTNTAGNIVADGSYNMKFAAYTADTGGTLLWSETRETTDRVTVTNGLFSVRLGEVTPMIASSFLNNSTIYFEIQMANPATATCSTAACAVYESPMTPRSRMATSAYAFNSTYSTLATTATSASSASNATNLGSVAAANYARLDVANTFAGTNDFANTATFNGGATIDSFSGGSWINMPTAGPSAIGSGGAGSNAWIGYASGAGNYFTDAVAGDLAYRNTSGRILLGNSGGHSQVALSSNNVTFNPLADTTNAFQIQNAAFAPFFTVDTSAGSMKLQVGSTTADANNIQFVLDSATADPTGAEGGSYYNTSRNTFRCFTDSWWQDCGPQTKKLTADVVNSTTTIANVTGLSFPVLASTDYRLLCSLMYQSAAITTGIKISATGPTAPNAVSGHSITYTTATAAGVSMFNAYDGGTATTGVVTANANIPATFDMTFRNGTTAGTLQLRFNSEVATSAVTMKIGSSCSLTSL